MANRSSEIGSTYDMFLNDLREARQRGELPILPHNEAERLVGVANDEKLPANQRAQARNALVASSLGLIPLILERFNPKIPAEDFIGFNFETILGCIKTYNSDKGDFSSHVYSSLFLSNLSIQGEELLTRRSSISSKSFMRNHYYRLTIAAKELEMTLGRQPTNDEWYEEVNKGQEHKMRRETFDAAVRRMRSRKSSIDNGSELYDGSVDVEAAVIYMELRTKTFPDAFKKLKALDEERKRKNLVGRHPNRDTDMLVVERLLEGKSQAEIANELDVSRQAVNIRLERVLKELAQVMGDYGDYADIDFGQVEET